MEKTVFMPKIDGDLINCGLTKPKNGKSALARSLQEVTEKWKLILQMPRLRTFQVDSQSGEAIRCKKENGVWTAEICDEGMPPKRLSIRSGQSIATRLAWLSVGFTPTVTLDFD